MVQRLKDSVQRFITSWKSRPRLEERPVPEEDPLIHSSLSGPIAISALLLILTLVWALYNEAWGLRPWVSYQKQFVTLYTEYLNKLRPKSVGEEKALYASQGYQKLAKRVDQAEARVKDQLAQLDAEERRVRQQLAAIQKFFIELRSKVQAKIYEAETSSGSAKQKQERELEELKKGPYPLVVPANGAEEKTAEKSYTYEELEKEFNSLKSRQGHIQTRRVELLRVPSELRRELNNYVKIRLPGLTAGQVDGLLAKMKSFSVEIKQIHNAEMNLVDRCESCHLGAREPALITTADMDGKAWFAGHTDRRLLEIHDPEVFGCSPCHNGNGVGTLSVTRAHGQYKHWLWPLYARENFEAGCLQCHEADRRLEHAPALSTGKELFYVKGCWGCHAREGFDFEPRLLRDVQKSIAELKNKREATEIGINRTIDRADKAPTNEEANRLYAAAENLTLEIAKIDTELERLTARRDELMAEVKTVGPNLKEVRNKLRREWLPVWIKNPHAFRATTKMPRFRLEDAQVRALAAFIWQSGVEAEVPKHPAGDAAKGKTLFETRGCLACHSVGEGGQAVGGTFAANLSRVGEKASYDYLVRWVHNPRERTLPYCPVHKRDIMPQDYAGQGLPFEFGAEKNHCPLGDHPLQVQQLTVMPSLRLTWEESRDIAGYLITLKRADAAYASVPYLDDPGLAAEGRFLVRHYGCSGCHEIASLEDEGKIGTDLTLEGSKPIERLDFALLTDEAKQEGWYNHKGFFEHKLADPAVYDQDKIKKPLEKLRMPNFDLRKDEITQLTTFLLGSVASKIPPQFFYRPADHRRDIQEGWAVAMKYNCVACHQFAPGQETVMEGLPLYQSPDGRDQLPPNLVGEGARVDPNWLARFLKNPALSDTDLNRNGVRPYLQARMPTFHLSNGEVQKLVRFFEALSNQPMPYLPPALPQLTERELTMARQLFTHPAAPCLRCHATGDPVTDRTATAPNFLLVRERLKPAWTERWIVHPEIIRPGTAMPSGLFRWDGSRWVFALAELDSFKGYSGDHADLVVRYTFQLTAEEQRRLQAH